MFMMMLMVIIILVRLVSFLLQRRTLAIKEMTDCSKATKFLCETTVNTKVNVALLNGPLSLNVSHLHPYRLSQKFCSITTPGFVTTLIFAIVVIIWPWLAFVCCCIAVTLMMTVISQHVIEYKSVRLTKTQILQQNLNDISFAFVQRFPTFREGTCRLRRICRAAEWGK